MNGHCMKFMLTSYSYQSSRHGSKATKNNEIICGSRLGHSKYVVCLATYDTIAKQKYLKSAIFDLIEIWIWFIVLIEHNKLGVILHHRENDPKFISHPLVYFSSFVLCSQHFFNKQTFKLYTLTSLIAEFADDGGDIKNKRKKTVTYVVFLNRLRDIEWNRMCWRAITATPHHTYTHTPSYHMEHSTTCLCSSIKSIRGILYIFLRPTRFALVGGSFWGLVPMWRHRRAYSQTHIHQALTLSIPYALRAFSTVRFLHTHESYAMCTCV